MSEQVGGRPPASLRVGKTARVRETAADRARRMLVGLRVGPSRTTVLTAIGGITLFIAVLVIGYLTR